MAREFTWKQGVSLPHDPDDIDDIELDLTALVGDADTLASATVTATGVTAAILGTTTEGLVTFRLSGGTAGETSFVTIQATMGSGRKQSRTINFNVLER